MKDTSDSSVIDKALTALDEYVLLGRSGLRVSPLSLGTMVIYSKWYSRFKTFGEDWGFGNDKQACKKIFDTYYERGGNFFDTVNPSTGQAIAGATSTRNPNAGGNHRKNLAESLNDSLKRLGTGYVDVLYVHVWEYRTPIFEVMRALDDVVRSGKAHYVAISDAPSWVISSANTVADLRGLTPFIGLQTKYNLLSRSLESDLQPMSAEFGLGIIPWSILAEGFLTGKHTRGQVSEDSKRVQATSHFKKEKNWKILDEVKAIAQECKRTPAQVAVNWTLQKPGITSPLIGARTLSQLEDNLGALDFTLSKSQMARLDAVSNPTEWPFPHDVVKGLDTWTGLGIKIEFPEKYQAVRKLGTSKL
ncbi:hypothetical protein BGZ76_003612 [Entomortierella beljakovae]|nr:hypothetical protein BGZ76_003612 [Entomortierella beljakovae]